MCFWVNDASRVDAYEKTHIPNEKNRHSSGAFIWNPATSYSPGRFPSRSLPPENSHSRGPPWPLFAILDASPRCIAHRARSAPVPLAAHGWKPNQVQCCTWLKTAREQLSPGRFSPCCIAHRARMGKNLAKYNVALTCRRPGSSSLPGVSHRALFLRGTRIVAPLAAPCDSRRSACLFPPLAAAGSGPTGRAWGKT